MHDTIKYIIEFILGDHLSPTLASHIGYTNDQKEWNKYRIIIKPSGFFDDNIYGSISTLPSTPLKIWEETPILYGEPVCEQFEDRFVLHADLIASTYFLLSRYEEYVRRDVRDSHGRFPGKESLPYRAGFIDRPLVDEYGVLLRHYLRESGLDIDEPSKHIRKIYLTHDIDQLAHYRNLRGMLGGMLRGLKRPKEGKQAFNSYFGSLRNDPWYTFPFLFKLASQLNNIHGKQNIETIAFVRVAGNKYKEDKPYPNLLHPDFKHLIKYCKRKEVTIGLHTSYESGIEIELATDEKLKLEKTTKTTINYNRYHYLNTRHPENFESLITAGITEDFTLGYADMAGFRLGTCRPVKYINPASRKVRDLTLHSLTIMDRTLDDKRYMFMNAFDAYQFCIQLIDCIEKYNGELCLLWHNNTVEKTPRSYQRKLYGDIIKYLAEKDLNNTFPQKLDE